MNVSHTMLSCWRRCRRRFYWNYVHHYTKPATGLGLRVGAAGHEALALWYSGHSAEDCLVAAERALHASAPQSGYTLEGEIAGEYDPQAEIVALAATLTRYFLWSKDEDKAFIPLRTEFAFDTTLSPRHQLKGFVDAIFERADGQRFFVEHKFNKNATVTHIPLDPQIATYLVAARLLNLAVDGVLYNIIRTAGGPTAIREPAVRVYQAVGVEGLRAWWAELCVMADEVDTMLHGYSRDQQIRAAYRMPQDACNWDCDYYPVCLTIQAEGEAAGAEALARDYVVSEYRGRKDRGST